MKKVCSALFLVMILGGCMPKMKPPHTVIQIDTQQDKQAGRFVCEFRTKQSELSKTGVPACYDPDGLNSSDLEQDFRSAVLANPACVNVTVKDIPPKDGERNLSINTILMFGVKLDEKTSALSPQTSGWTLNGPNPPNGSFRATGLVGNMYETAANICRIAKHEGGSVQ